MKEIKLTQGKIALVDDCDYDWLNQYKWSVQKGYAKRNDYKNNKRTTIYMHIELYLKYFGKIPEGRVVDHIDRNPLNNQLSNLRLATHAENMRNRCKSITNTSGSKGISKYIDKKQYKDKIYINEYWKVQITKEKKTYTKYFPYTEEGKIQAAKWHDQKAKELFGKFCGELNFPDEND